MEGGRGPAAAGEGFRRLLSDPALRALAEAGEPEADPGRGEVAVGFGSNIYVVARASGRRVELSMKIYDVAEAVARGATVAEAAASLCGAARWLLRAWEAALGLALGLAASVRGEEGAEEIRRLAEPVTEAMDRAAEAVCAASGRAGEPGD